MTYELRIKLLTALSVVILFSIWGTLLVFPLTTIQARVTPEDIVNSKKEAYGEKILGYSPSHKQQLEIFASKIVEVNKRRSEELDRIMTTQAAILDEYERRREGKDVEGIKNARYWITYAHEAVAYQAAKIYIFNLTSEGNIRNDALSTISLFQSELNSTRSKVIKSQKIIEGLVKNQ